MALTFVDGRVSKMLLSSGWALKLRVKSANCSRHSVLASNPDRMHCSKAQARVASDAGSSHELLCKTEQPLC